MPGGHPHHRGSALSKPRERSKNWGLQKEGESKSKQTGFLRLYVKGVFTGFRRSKVDQNENIALLRLENVNCKEDTAFYFGKRVAYVYRVNKKNKEGSKFRVIWGKVTRAHGSGGTVRARFNSNLPPAAMGQRVRVMLYPSNV